MTPKARKHKQTILGFALLGFGTLLVLVIALIPRFLSKAYDPQTLCLLEVPLQTHVLILVDRTDPLTPLQSVIFRKLLHHRSPRRSTLFNVQSRTQRGREPTLRKSSAGAAVL
jgi:hypothetical protein